MSETPQRRSRLPHWGWWLLASIVLVICFAGLSIWLPWHRERQVIEKIDEWGGRVETTIDNPEWLERIVGKEQLNESKLFERAIKIQLSGPEISDDRIAQLSGMSRLRGLDIRRSAVTDAGLAHLIGLSGLKYLILDRTAVTDDGLALLQRLPNLRTLSLDRTAITDAGLVHLASVPSLQRLHVNQTRVTDQGVADLKKALPECDIRQ